MKKITFLLLLFITSFTFGQTVLSEDFEAGLTLPAGWTNNDIQGNAPPEIWEFENTGELGGFGTPNTFIYDFGECVGNYAHFDSDGYGNNGTAENAALESPVFSCAALTQVTLSFNHIFGAGYGGAGFVEVFDGTSWVQVDSYAAANDFGLKSIDVSAELAGVANAQVRFRWTGDWALAWAVDNVSVFQCTVNAPDAVTAAVSPTDTETDVPVTYDTDTNTIGPFEWTPAATGDPADSFNWSFGLTATGDDIGTVTGLTNGNSINFTMWEPNTTYFWKVDAVNCAGVTPGPVWSFTTEACTVSAPTVTSESPADNATGVAIAGPDGVVTFSWADGGDPATAYRLNLGTTDPPGQAFENFANGGTISGLTVNTEWFWSVDAINCAGETLGTVWSFTTDTTLSVEDDNQLIPSFKVYPNPTSDVLNIKTSLEIDSIVVTNLVGQQVARYNGNTISNNSVNLSELSQGLYMVTITAGDKSDTFKVNKK